MNNIKLFNEDRNNKDDDDIYKDSIELLDKYYNNKYNLISFIDNELAELVSLLNYYKCNSILQVLYHIKERFKKIKLEEFISEYNIDDEIINYLNNIKISTWKEYDEDAFIDEEIYENIISICDDYHNYNSIFNINDFDDEYERYLNQDNFEYQLNKMRVKYIEFIEPLLNKNFQGLKKNCKMDAITFQYEFNKFVSYYNSYKDFDEIKSDL